MKLKEYAQATAHLMQALLAGETIQYRPAHDLGLGRWVEFVEVRREQD